MQAAPASPDGHAGLVADWRAMDMRARLAEEELRSAWNAWFERRGPMPTDELVAQVRQRRQAANESLDRAIRAHRDASMASQRR